MSAPPRPVQRLVSALRPTRTRQSTFENVLGTTLEVQVAAGSREQAQKAERALLAEIDRLEPVFSRFLPDSELNRWLVSSGAAAVSPELGQVLQRAQHWQEISGGAFHPATEALSPLWKAAERIGRPPGAEVLQARLREMAGPLYTVRHTAQSWTAERHTPLPLGFNAFAKGFIADLACAAAFAAPGVSRVLVNIGGDLRAMGPGDVRVEIADPSTLADNAAPICSVRLEGRGAATSGRARRGFLVGDTWHSHVLDPRSGQPVSHVVSASVVAESSASADVLATIFSVLDVPGSLRLADRLPEVACLLIDEHGQQHRNARWNAIQL